MILQLGALGFSWLRPSLPFLLTRETLSPADFLDWGGAIPLCRLRDQRRRAVRLPAPDFDARVSSAHENRDFSPRPS